MDNKVLNLSTFGEIIDPRGQEGNFPTFDQIKKMGSKMNQEVHTQSVHGRMVNRILYIQAQTKLLHWQTFSVNQHKNLDKLHKDFLGLSDQLVEVVAGKYGRPKLTKEECCFEIQNYRHHEEGMSSFMCYLYEVFTQEIKPCFNKEKDSEILNIIDEIVAMIDQYTYLFSFNKP